MSLLVKGVTEFLKLTDTPASYSGQASRVAAVKATEDELEFIDPPERASSNITCVEPQSFRPTAANTWEDFDLSKVVPEGATGAVFHLVNTVTGEESHMGLRKKGSIDNYYGSLSRDFHGWAMVGLDENRKCQGYCEHLGSNHFLLVGYTGENYTFFTNGHNIVPATKTEWVDTDLSSYCPGAIAAIIEFATHLDARDMVGARKHGSTDDRHGSAFHMWMVVGLDASQHLDLYDEDWPTPADAFNLIGYITAGVTMYTNADDISPVADGTYHAVSLTGYKVNPIIAFIEIVSTSRTEDFAIRKNWVCGEVYKDAANHNFAIPHPNTPNDNLEVKLSNVCIQLYLLGVG